ncbi:hypothetical protein ACFVHB_10985 [Kitasatospora sp. NPDC127111]|uniref:hypothetical protein n=1 Tax=Kitasatospora sp. NPDC127111 TaxID=3345363 RepID=UPI0036345874
MATAGAAVVPLLWLVLTGEGQSEVAAIERSGSLPLEHGSPYLAEPHTVAEYIPYLPGMALLGPPRALLGSDGWAARPSPLCGRGRLAAAAGRRTLPGLTHYGQALGRPLPRARRGRHE